MSMPFFGSNPPPATVSDVTDDGLDGVVRPLTPSEMSLESWDSEDEKPWPEKVRLSRGIMMDMLHDILPTLTPEELESVHERVGMEKARRAGEMA
jgi:hypothetical protein